MSTISVTELFKRKLRNLEQAHRNYNPRGRNAEGSRHSIEWRFQSLRDLTRLDEVCDLLDNNPRLAERWNRMERHMAGLPGVLVTTSVTTTEVEEAKAVYRTVRTAFLAAMDNEDAAFARYFAKRASGVRTNGAAVSRLSNLTNYLSAELSAAQSRLFLLDVDPWELDDKDKIPRIPV